MPLVLPSWLMRIACAFLCATLAVELCAEEHLCRTSDGKTFRGLLVRFDEKGNPVFDTNTGSRTVLLDQLLFWGDLQDSPNGTQVLLADGSLIVADEVQLDGESLVVKSQLFGEVKGFSIAGTSRVPVSAVRAIVFRVPLRPADRDRLLKRVTEVKKFEDQLWLANGDILPGAISQLGREAVDGKPEPTSVTIKTTAGEVTIRPDEPQDKLLEKVQAIVFNPALVRKVKADAPKMLIGLADGSRMFATQVEADGERATFILASGVTLTSHPDENIWRRIVSLQSFGPHVRYLSDLSPNDASYRQTTLLGRTWPLGVDENVTGGKLRSEGNLYVKGIGMHSRARAVFVLDRSYSRLEAELAIDESAGKLGSVVFLLARHVDGKFQIVPESKTLVRGGDAPKSISIDLTGAGAVALFVEPADHGDVMDRANWLNARLIPARQ